MGPWFLVLGPWSLVLDRNKLQSTKYPVPGTQYPVPSTQYLNSYFFLLIVISVTIKFADTSTALTIFSATSDGSIKPDISLF